MRELNDLMDFDHVIRVHKDGAITEPRDVYAPELLMGVDADGQILNAHEAGYIADAKRQGWSLERGWTGQYSYSGVVMHPSEYVGKSMEDHIRETPGLWVVIVVQCEDDYDAGWALAYQEVAGDDRDG